MSLKNSIATKLNQKIVLTKKWKIILGTSAAALILLVVLGILISYLDTQQRLTAILRKLNESDQQMINQLLADDTALTPTPDGVDLVPTIFNPANFASCQGIDKLDLSNSGIKTKCPKGFYYSLKYFEPNITEFVQARYLENLETHIPYVSVEIIPKAFAQGSNLYEWFKKNNKQPVSTKKFNPNCTPTPTADGCMPELGCFDYQEHQENNTITYGCYAMSDTGFYTYTSIKHGDDYDVIIIHNLVSGQSDDQAITDHTKAVKEILDHLSR